MSVGVVVDGRSEYGSLPELREALAQAVGRPILNPLLADIQPKAPVGVIARQCAARVAQLERMGVAVVVILLDREDRRDCCGELAQAIELAIQRAVPSCAVQLRVVIKDRAFENWLVADLQALAAQPGRFTISRTFRRAVEPDRADRADAERLLKQATGSRYDKVADSRRILARADVDRMALNSRSFRRFLRVIGHPRYAGQSARP